GTTIGNPTGNVDVAPTVAYLFGLSMPQADGRVLNEALVKPASSSAPSLTASVVNPASAATGLVFKSPVDPTGATVDAALGSGNYSINLVVKDLTVDGRTFRYFDYAQAVRN
ncbi:MAG TPA: phosphodiesterase, partial [Caldimonas sp.]